MVIRAVIFDFGGTLAEGSIDWGEYHNSIQELLRGLGFDVEIGRLKRAVGAALERLERVRSRNEELTLEEVYAYALDKLGIPAQDETLKMIHGLFRQHFRTTLYPCTEEVLRALSKRYRLAVLSNTMSDTSRVFLQQAGLISYFDLVVCSCDLGIRKPNPKIFQYVLEKMGVSPSEAVHVGDGVDTDMEGASGAGIRGIWIKGSETSGWSGLAVKSVCDLPELLAKMED